jgi:hypothetical protein
MRSLGAVGLCSPAVFIDGMMMTQIEGLDIEQFVNVQDVRSLEVYVRNTQIPVQFQTQNNCGSIVITTGMRRRPLPP